ncbi:unnamed protein product [Periconia digitata]|uniref:Uncharacterized protein n=1 Tax=Periconia digitata TaxID=1303443 RepID=A0A9W4U8N8_9PLEO|nr:unnamed protein product [Periconia digitata]
MPPREKHRKKWRDSLHTLIEQVESPGNDFSRHLLMEFSLYLYFATESQYSNVPQALQKSPLQTSEQYDEQNVGFFVHRRLYCDSVCTVVPELQDLFDLVVLLCREKIRAQMSAPLSITLPAGPTNGDIDKAMRIAFQIGDQKANLEDVEGETNHLVDGSLVRPSLTPSLVADLMELNGYQLYPDRQKEEELEKGLYWEQENEVTQLLQMRR